NLPGVEQVSYLTSESMMDIDFLPEHLLIVGGSYVGLEFGQMYRRFGSQVTIIETGPRLIGREDPDVSDALRDILAAEDIEIRLNAKCLALEPAREGILLRLECGLGAFTHTAYNDYEIVADNLLNGENRKVSDRIPIYGLFTDPPLGRLGMSEAEARRAGYNILIGRMPMTDVARAREKGETQGFM